MKACYLVAEAQVKLNLLQVDSKHVSYGNAWMPSFLILKTFQALVQCLLCCP